MCIYYILSSCMHAHMQNIPKQTIAPDCGPYVCKVYIYVDMHDYNSKYILSNCCQ